jgi:hypothetical protein
MTQEDTSQSIDFTVDKTNLYREEAFTDFKVASIRKLIPIRPDGTDDESRTPVFIGTTQIMSPSGPLPIQEVLKANNFQEALEIFPDAMEKGFEQMVERLKKMQEQENEKNDSRIIVPGM